MSNSTAVVARPYRWRFIAAGCGILIWTVVSRQGYFHSSPAPGDQSLKEHVASDHSASLYPRAARSILPENDISLPYYTAPFQCDIGALPDKARLTTWSPENYVIVVHGQPDIVSDFTWSSGGWESGLTKDMLTFLDAFSAVEPARNGYVDLGTNIGSHAIPIAARKYNVHAFEPTTANNVLVRCSLALGGMGTNFRLNTFGLGEKPETVCMKWEAENNYGGSHIEWDGAKSEVCPEVRQAHIGTLDHYYQRVLSGKQKIGVMKMDIQGFEIKAMRSASKFFNSNEAPAAVFFEYEVGVLTKQGHDPKELPMFFVDHGYVIWRNDRKEPLRDEEYDWFGKKEGYPDGGAGADFTAIKKTWVEKLENAGYLLHGHKILGKSFSQSSVQK